MKRIYEITKRDIKKAAKIKNQVEAKLTQIEENKTKKAKATARPNLNAGPRLEIEKLSVGEGCFREAGETTGDLSLAFGASTLSPRLSFSVCDTVLSNSFSSIL